MTLFYLIILGINVSLLMTRNDDFDKILLSIEKRRKTFTTIAYVYIVFIGCFMFPIRIGQDNSFLVDMLIGYFYLTIVLYALYRKRALFVFSITFLLNAIGLLCRVLLEWGEYTITRDLTQLNVVVYLVAIPLVVIFIYSLIPILRRAK